MSLGGGGAFVGGGGGLTAPVSAADVKHRYVIGGWRVVNKTANSTTAGTIYGSDLSWVCARAVNIQRWTYYGSAAVAGSALTVEISVNGGSSYATLGTCAIGVVAQSAAATGAPIAVADGAEIRVRYVTDASWTSTSADPQVWLEVEEQ